MATIIQKTAGGQVIARFQALEDFEEPRFNNSVYLKGMEYNLREGNDKLAKILEEEWIPAGKVKYV